MKDDEMTKEWKHRKMDGYRHQWVEGLANAGILSVAGCGEDIH